MTNHYKNKRYKRERFINKHFSDGYIVDEFVVDRGHPNGLERHCVMNNGVIVIYNLMNGKLITKLLARPGQIKRLYKNSKKEFPVEYENILELARQHEKLGYNKL